MDIGEADKEASLASKRVAESCSQVAVGCSDVVGIVEAVVSSSESFRTEHQLLKEKFGELEADQLRVSEANDASRALSHEALLAVDDGTKLINESLEKLNTLIEEVKVFSTRMDRVTGALKQVEKATDNIAGIVEQTNIIALNAMIEAGRAGGTGATFQVVANEVKNLSASIKVSNQDIAQTVRALAAETGDTRAALDRITDTNAMADFSIRQITDTLKSVETKVSEVDRQSEVSAQSSETISSHVDELQQVVVGFDQASVANEANLREAITSISELELISNNMFNDLVHAGLSVEDTEQVREAQQAAEQIREVTEAALASAELSEAALFDSNYQPIAESDPPRFYTRLTNWADIHWRPILDRAFGQSERISLAVCVDMSGFMPTHLSVRSKPPTGNPTIDAIHSRNGRMIDSAAERAARKNAKEFMMAVYRQDKEGGGYRIMRIVYIPLVFNGVRWGNFGFAYAPRD